MFYRASNKQSKCTYLVSYVLIRFKFTAKGFFLKKYKNKKNEVNAKSIKIWYATAADFATALISLSVAVHANAFKSTEDYLINSIKKKL